jgi:hypothetical protein
MDDPTYHPRVDPLATRAQEHGLARLLRHQLCPGLPQPRLDGAQSRPPEGYGSLLASLAEHSDHLAGPIKIGQVEAT